MVLFLSVKIRLKRMGRRKRPFYRIVAIDSKTRRDGREIERLGWFDPLNLDVAINSLFEISFVRI